MSYRFQSPSGVPPPHSSFPHYSSSSNQTSQQQNTYPNAQTNTNNKQQTNQYGAGHFQSGNSTGFSMGSGMSGGLHRSTSHPHHDTHHTSSGWDDTNNTSSQSSTASSSTTAHDETHANWENYGAGFTSPPAGGTTPHHDSHSHSHSHSHSLTHPHTHQHSIETPSKTEKLDRDGHNDRKLDPNMDLDFGLDLKKLGLDVDDDDDTAGGTARNGGGGGMEEDDIDTELVSARGAGNGQPATGGGKRRSKRRSAEEEKEPVINVLSLLYDPPVEGCILKPYVSITDSEGVTTALRANLGDDTTEDDTDSPVEWRWYRGQKRICSVTSCQGGANLQCLSCLKSKLPVHMAYFCSAKCWRDAWPIHRSLHARNPIQPAVVTNSNGETSTSWDCDDADEYTVERPDSPTAISCKFPPPVSNIWAEVARSRSYTPVAEDVGRALRIECAPIIKRGILIPPTEVNDGHHISNPHISINPVILNMINGQIQANLLGNWTRIDTSAVMVAPGPPTPRQVIYRQAHQATSGSPFKVVCFNVLAQIYATNQIYPYCAIWALNWDYRKKILLREICSHNADIICLQEVQANHFDSFFQPGLSKAGYDGIFKRKTRDAVGDMHPDSIDGCAIFYRRERFALMEQYGIEFNEAARQQTSDRKSLRRLLKGNIALVVVLEELTSGTAQTQRRQRKRRLCVANTHIYWDPEYADVKLWQTWVLCQELEKLVLHRNLPLLLCGDFNSMVDSSVYELLSQERITNKRVYDSDPCGILPDLNELRHRLPLVSLYASIGEPKYTNFTGHFVGVLDYMFFTKTHMISTSILDVDAESVLRDHTALPSPQFSSDHISLVGELDWLLDA